MDDHEPELTVMPADLDDRSLWLQHAVGFEVMRRVREPARDRAAASFTGDELERAYALIDGTIYDLFMLIEGIPLSLRNADHEIIVDLVGRVERRSDGEAITQQSMRDGDGITVGYHGWIAGDYGDRPPAFIE